MATPQTAQQLLKDSLELIDDEYDWGKGAYVTDQHLNNIDFKQTLTEPCIYCAAGAIHYTAYHSQYDSEIVKEALITLASTMTKRNTNSPQIADGIITTFNDKKETTYKMIQESYLQAIESLN